MTITAELADGRRLEFPDGTDPSVVQATVKKMLAPKVAPMPEPAFEREARDPASGYNAGEQFFAGMGKGMTDVGRGVAQLTPWGPSRQDIDEIRRRDASLMQSGAGAAGDVVGTMAAYAPAALIPGAGSILGSAAIGGGLGAIAPVGEQDSRAQNAAVGSALGGGLSAGIKAASPAVSFVGKGVRNLADMVRKGGEKNILSRYQTTITGEQNIPAVVNALRTKSPLVTGGKPTAAELLHDIPEGSPLAAHQKITASTPGGTSAQFGRRIQEQDQAIKGAEQIRDAVTGQMRAASLKSTGNVNTTGIVQRIDGIVSDPTTPTLTQRVLRDMKDEILDRSKGQSAIDAEALYTVRKQIGLMIDKHLPTNAQWDKSVTAKHEKSIQRLIDDAIESSGGSGWRQYLKEYSNRTKAIEGFQERRELAYKPDQKTNLRGGINIGEEVRLHSPQMLSRPMMLTNYLMKKLGSGVEPRIDVEAAARYLEPQQLADALAKAQAQGQNRKQIADMLRRYAVPATMATQEGVSQ